MRWATCLAVGLAATVAGCGDQAQTQSDADVKALRGRCDSLKRENETLKTTIDRLKVDSAAADRKMYGLKQENEALKRQLESARAAATKAAAAVASAGSGAAAEPAPFETAVTPGAGSGMGGGFAPPPVIPGAAPPGAVADPSQTVAGLEKAVADLEDRITAARTKVAQTRSNVSDLSRSTIDQATPVPAGGIIKNDIVYKKEGLIVAPYYQYVPIGPALRKGDFSTQREKDDAIKKARGEAASLEQELKSLQAEQTAAKAKLLKLKAAAATPAPAPGETPAQPPPPAAQPLEDLTP